MKRESAGRRQPGAEAHYPAVVHREEGSDWGVSFPDFPGLVAAGDSFDAALRDATAALSAHVDWLDDEGEAVPPPSDPADHVAEALEGRGQVVTVPLVRPRGRRRAVNLSLPENEVAALDRAARNAGMDRSAFVRYALRVATGSLGVPAVGSVGSKKRKAAGA